MTDETQAGAMSGEYRSVLWDVHGAPTVQRIEFIEGQPFLKGEPVRDWKPIRWDGRRYVVDGEGDGSETASGFSGPREA